MSHCEICGKWLPSADGICGECIADTIRDILDRVERLGRIAGGIA